MAQQQQYQAYQRMAALLAGKHRDRLPAVQQLCNNAKAILSNVGAAAALPPAACGLQCGQPLLCCDTLAPSCALLNTAAGVP